MGNPLSSLVVTTATPIVTRHKQLSNLSNSCSEIFWTQNDKSRRCRENWRKERESGLDMVSDRPNESTGFERREVPDFAVSSSIPTLKTTKSPRVRVPGAFIRESLCYDNIGGGAGTRTRVQKRANQSVYEHILQFNSRACRLLQAGYIGPSP